MKIQILKTTMVGGQLVAAGEVVEASSSDARLLLGIGKAVAATVTAEPKRKPRTKVTPDGNLSTDP